MSSRMNRRDFFATAGAGAVCVGLAAALAQADGLPDALYVETYRRYFAPDEEVEVCLNGTAITNRCVAANRAVGWVDLIPERDDPAWQTAVHSAPIRRHHGIVTFRRVRI